MTILDVTITFLVINGDYFIAKASYAYLLGCGLRITEFHCSNFSFKYAGLVAKFM